VFGDVRVAADQRIATPIRGLFGTWQLRDERGRETTTGSTTKERWVLMAEQTKAQLKAIKRIMILCFHQDDVDQTIDALVVLGVKPDLITRAMSSAPHD
jgi:hypothetical protein